MYTEIKKCRICGNRELVPILNLGNQHLTGVFPKNKSESITLGPLELTKCADNANVDACGLLQLRHSYNGTQMYGENYGYRSGLNKVMVGHLQEKVRNIESFIKLSSGDLVVDIGSNDSTMLQAYSDRNLLLVGIDPTGEKFRKYYPEYIRLISDFFSLEALRKAIGVKKAKVITSIAMFYDLESPLDFAGDIFEVLADDGVWVFEQSYMPTMLKMNAYDTICHEHLEYYSLKQIKWIADKIGFKILDVTFNDANGGSFSVVAAKRCAPYREKTELVNNIILQENKQGLHTLAPYEAFRERVFSHRQQLCDFIKQANTNNKKVFGYGASTKGNVVLQFCNLTNKDIPFIAEVNNDKFGCYTPGTNISIISEEEARAMKPDYFMVLPWHFKSGIIQKEQSFISSGGRLLFPLPSLEVVEK